MNGRLLSTLTASRGVGVHDWPPKKGKERYHRQQKTPEVTDPQGSSVSSHPETSRSWPCSRRRYRTSSRPTACIRGAGIGRSAEAWSCTPAGKARNQRGRSMAIGVANDRNSGSGSRVLAGSALRSCVVRCGGWPGRRWCGWPFRPGRAPRPPTTACGGGAGAYPTAGQALPSDLRARAGAAA